MRYFILITLLLIFSGCSQKSVVMPQKSKELSQIEQCDSCISSIFKKPTRLLILEHRNDIYKKIIRRQLEVLVVLTTPNMEVVASTVDSIVEDSKKLLLELDKKI